MVELPKPRALRAERQPELTYYSSSHEESFGWAVSYADVLMVLLSFFVLFFSFSKNESSLIMRSIVSTMTSGQTATTASSTGFKSGTTHQVPKEQINDLVLSLQRLIVDARVKKKMDGDILVLLLPDDSYKPGAIEMEDSPREILNATLQKLAPYKNAVDVTLIGFADSQAISKQKNSVIRNNFDLSAIRATRALENAVRSGFPIEHLRAKGSSHFDRDARTLAIQVSVRGEE